MFRRWTIKNPQHDGNLYIRFDSTKELHLSTALASVIQKECEEAGGKPAFDMYVDSAERLIGIAPVCGGEFKFKTIPPTLGMAVFMHRYSPVIGERLSVEWLEGDKEQARPGMWVAHMDKAIPPIRL